MSLNPQILLSVYKTKYHKYSRIRSHLTILTIDNRIYLCKSEHTSDTCLVSKEAVTKKKEEKEKGHRGSKRNHSGWRVDAEDITWLLYLSARFLPIFLCLVEAKPLNGYENYYRHRRSTSGDYLSTPDR